LAVDRHFNAPPFVTVIPALNLGVPAFAGSTGAPYSAAIFAAAPFSRPAIASAASRPSRIA